MKNFKIKNVEITDEIISKLVSVKENVENFMSLNEKYKYSYFWSNNGNAASRARQSKKDSFEFELAIEQLQFSISLEFYVRMSCMNVYITKNIYINKRLTTSRSFEKLLNEIDEIFNLVRIAAA